MNKKSIVAVDEAVVSQLVLWTGALINIIIILIIYDFRFTFTYYG